MKYAKIENGTVKVFNTLPKIYENIILEDETNPKSTEKSPNYYICYSENNNKNKSSSRRGGDRPDRSSNNDRKPTGFGRKRRERR